MSDTLNAPHLKFIADEKIDIDSAELSASLRNKIVRWDKNHQKFNSATTDSDLKNKLKKTLESESKELNDDLKEELKESLNAASAKKKAEEADTKKKAEEADAKKKAEEAANKSKANPFGLSDTQLEQKKIIDKLYSEKNVKGVVEVSEAELSELGFECWSHLGMVGGQLGPYKFTSGFFSETWKIEKSEQKPNS